jgi:iron complex transport system ATP-binding protein
VVLSLRVEHVRFSYGRDSSLLDDVGFDLAAGDVLYLLGPNGSGKTTLLRCVLGLQRIQAGSIQIHGRHLGALTRRRVARELAYVPQSSLAIFPYAAFDMVLMGRSPHLRFMASPTRTDRRLARAAFEGLGIAHLADQVFHELSGGERQMVLIARALAQGSKVIVMDEPCAGLDYGNQVRILTTIRALARQGYTILLTSHLPDHAFLVGTKVALLKHGRLRGPGAPQEVITADALSELYGTPVRVIHVRVADSPVTDLSLCVPLVEDQETINDEALALRLSRDAGLLLGQSGGRDPSR